MNTTTSWIGTLALLIACAPAMAAEGESKKRAKKAEAPRAEPVSLEQRVAESKFIFLGEGVRIYFLDRQYRETPYIRAADDGRLKSAVLVMKVIKQLQPEKGEVPAQLLVPISTDRDVFGEGRSHYDHQVARFVGKQWIWFGDFTTVREYGDPKAPRPLENPVTFFRAGKGGGAAAGEATEGSGGEHQQEGGWRTAEGGSCYLETRSSNDCQRGAGRGRAEGWNNRGKVGSWGGQGKLPSPLIVTRISSPASRHRS